METKSCQNCHINFVIEPEDFRFYEKMQVPPPTFCPECRMIRRLAFRNQKNLFIRKDDASGKDIFSGIPQSAPIKVYDLEYWNSDYCDQAGYMKNCYLCFDADHNEDCAYCVRFHYTKNSFDISESVGNE